MPIANPKTNNTIPVTYGLKAARYQVLLPGSDILPSIAGTMNVLIAANGRELDLLMNDPRVTRFQPQQVRIRIVYEG